MMENLKTIFITIARIFLGMKIIMARSQFQKREQLLSLQKKT